MSQCKHILMRKRDGMYGDAITCCCCSYSKYPEAVSWWIRFKIWIGWIVVVSTAKVGFGLKRLTYKEVFDV